MYIHKKLLIIRSYLRYFRRKGTPILKDILNRLNSRKQLANKQRKYYVRTFDTPLNGRLVSYSFNL